MKNIFILMLLTTLSVFQLHCQTSENKPNILFISIDDLRPQLGAYGQKQMITPNLDQLAANGRLFTKHYVQVPTCGPSRACLLTGKNVTNKSDISHGHLGNVLADKPESSHPETFIHHLKQQGYYTVGMGKISHSGDGHRKKSKNNATELPHSWNEFINDPNTLWSRQEHVCAYANGKSKIGHDGYNPPTEFLDVPDENYPDGRLANLATDQLEKLAKQKKPFFMAVGFYKPHLPFSAPKKYWDLYDHNDITISSNPDLPKDVSNVFLHPSVEFYKQYTHPEYGGVGKRISDQYAKKIIHANYAAISYSDTQVGKVLNKLKALGLDKNTIIIVWGDHGWHLGDHTIWGKHSTFERALRSALIVKTPNQKKPGIPSNGLVASIDLYPTICELVGINKPMGLQGESFVSLIQNPKKKGKKAVMSYWRNILSMRTDRYRFAVHNNNQKQEIMLFDHQKDPFETINIASKKPEIVKELMIQMKKLNNNFLPNL